MRGVVIIIFIFIFLFLIIISNRSTFECYEGDYMAIAPSFTPLEPSIYFNIDELKKNINIMNQILESIDCKKKSKICQFDYIKLFGKTEEEISVYEMIKVLMEVYVDGFVNIYIRNRFNFTKYISIKYQYPEDNYEETEQFLFIIRNKVKYLTEKINEDNFDYNLFTMTIFDLKYNLEILENLYDNISSRSTFNLEDTKDIIKSLNSNYLQSVLKNYESKVLSLGFKFISSKDDSYLNYDKIIDKNHWFLYSLKEIHSDDVVDIIENIERMLENEINEIQIFLNKSN